MASRLRRSHEKGAMTSASSIRIAQIVRHYAAHRHPHVVRCTTDGLARGWRIEANGALQRLTGQRRWCHARGNDPRWASPRTTRLLHILASLKLPVLCLARLGVHPCSDAASSTPASSAESSCHSQSNPVAASNLTTAGFAASFGAHKHQTGMALRKLQRPADVPGPRRSFGPLTDDCAHSVCLAVLQPVRDERRICRFPFGR